jgi:hypothetical protein
LLLLLPHRGLRHFAKAFFNLFPQNFMQFFGVAKVIPLPAERPT